MPPSSLAMQGILCDILQVECITTPPILTNIIPPYLNMGLRPGTTPFYKNTFGQQRHVAPPPPHPTRIIMRSLKIF